MTDILLGTGLFTAIILVLVLVVVSAHAVLMPAVAVAVTVNSSRRIDTRSGRKLLAILTDAGIPIPSPCGGAGRCGLCRVTVAEGVGPPLPTETNLLSRRDLRAGVRLACQTVVRDDLRIDIPEELFGVQNWTCRVLSNRSLSPLIRELVLALPDGETIAFEAGAFVQITAPPYRLDFGHIDITAEYCELWEKHSLARLSAGTDKPATRAYSIASPPAVEDRIVLNIRLALPPPRAGRGVPPGIVSSYLFAAKPGDAVAVAGPFGNFSAQANDREMVFIGGGVGMAPLRSMILDQLVRQQATRKISFWYGARSRIELFYTEEFDALAAQHDNFAWTVALSDPAPDDKWDGETGFIHEVVFQRYLKNHPAPEGCEYYLCGPPLMTKAVLAMLDDLGVGRHRIYFDDFGS